MRHVSCSRWPGFEALTDDALVSLLSRTEGWAAGLRLAALLACRSG